MQMRIDKTRHNDAPGNIDLLLAVICAERPNNAITADRYIAFNELTRYEIEEAAIFEHNISWFTTGTLIYHLFKQWLTPFKSFSESISENNTSRRVQR